MLRCREVAVLASDYIDRELPARTRVAVRWHLLLCPRCRALVGNLRDTVQLLRRLSVKATPSRHWTRQTLEQIHAHIDRQE
ncbi:zf-HC2 domain-containing protein [Marinobacteraceae bacterium S3BR75-40.1]